MLTKTTNNFKRQNSRNPLINSDYLDMNEKSYTNNNDKITWLELQENKKKTNMEIEDKKLEQSRKQFDYESSSRALQRFRLLSLCLFIIPILVIFFFWLNFYEELFKIKIFLLIQILILVFSTSRFN